MANPDAIIRYGIDDSDLDAGHQRINRRVQETARIINSAFGGATGTVTQLSGAVLGVVGPMAAAAAAAEAARRSFLSFANVDMAMRRVQNSAQVTYATIEKYLPTMQRLASQSGRSLEEIITGFNELRERAHLTWQETEKLFPAVAQGAYAAGVPLDQMARTFSSIFFNLRIGAGNAGQLMDKLYSGSQAVNVNLGALSSSIPEITTMMRSWGQVGPDAINKTIARISVLKDALGDEQEAGQALTRMYQMMASPQIAQAIGRHPQQLWREMEAWSKAGKDPFEEILRRVGWAIENNRLQLNQLPPRIKIAYTTLLENQKTVIERTEEISKSSGRLAQNINNLNQSPLAAVRELTGEFTAMAREIAKAFSMLGVTDFLSQLTGVAKAVQAIAASFEVWGKFNRREVTWAQAREEWTVIEKRINENMRRASMSRAEFAKYEAEQRAKESYYPNVPGAGGYSGGDTSGAGGGPAPSPGRRWTTRQPAPGKAWRAGREVWSWFFPGRRPTGAPQEPPPEWTQTPIPDTEKWKQAPMALPPEPSAARRFQEYVPPPPPPQTYTTERSTGPARTYERGTTEEAEEARRRYAGRGGGTAAPPRQWPSTEELRGRFEDLFGEPAPPLTRGGGRGPAMIGPLSSLIGQVIGGIRLPDAHVALGNAIVLGVKEGVKEAIHETQSEHSVRGQPWTAEHPQPERGSTFYTPGSLGRFGRGTYTRTHIPSNEGFAGPTGPGGIALPPQTEFGRAGDIPRSVEELAGKGGPIDARSFAPPGGLPHWSIRNIRQRLRPWAWGFAEGGVVPGAPGQPLPATVHGGERVIAEKDRPWWETAYESVFGDPNFPGQVFQRSLEGGRPREPSIWDDPRSYSDWQLHPFYKNILTALAAAGPRISRSSEQSLRGYFGSDGYAMMEHMARNYKPAPPDWGNAASFGWVLKSIKLDAERGYPLRDFLLNKILPPTHFGAFEPYGAAQAINRLPRAARGGVTRGPTIAGEAGREAIIPLDQPMSTYTSPSQDIVQVARQQNTLANESLAEEQRMTDKLGQILEVLRRAFPAGGGGGGGGGGYAPGPGGGGGTVPPIMGPGGPGPGGYPGAPGTGGATPGGRYTGTGQFNFMGSQRAAAMGMNLKPGEGIEQRQTAVGMIKANKYAADDIAGFINDLAAAGAPLKNFSGVYNLRQKRGGGGWSQHAYGNAVDIETGAGWGPTNSPYLYAWAQQNPKLFQEILSKHHMVNLERGDWGHFEWSPGQREPAGSPEEASKALAQAVGPGSNLANLATENASGAWGRNRMSGMFRQVAEGAGELYGIPVGAGARGAGRFPAWARAKMAEILRTGGIDRSRFAAELQNPQLLETVLGIGAGENVGSAQKLFETMMNRADLMGTSLAQEATPRAIYGNRGYYAGYKPGLARNPQVRATLLAALGAALGRAHAGGAKQGEALNRIIDRGYLTGMTAAGGPAAAAAEAAFRIEGAPTYDEGARPIMRPFGAKVGEEFFPDWSKSAAGGDIIASALPALTGREGGGAHPELAGRNRAFEPEMGGLDRATRRRIAEYQRRERNEARASALTAEEAEYDRLHYASLDRATRRRMRANAARQALAERTRRPAAAGPGRGEGGTRVIRSRPVAGAGGDGAMEDPGGEIALQEGGFIKQEGSYYLHKNEAVIPLNQSPLARYASFWSRPSALAPKEDTLPEWAYEMEDIPTSPPTKEERPKPIPPVTLPEPELEWPGRRGDSQSTHTIKYRFERDPGEYQFRRASYEREVNSAIRESRWYGPEDIGIA